MFEKMLYIHYIPLMYSTWSILIHFGGVCDKTSQDWYCGTSKFAIVVSHNQDAMYSVIHLQYYIYIYIDLWVSFVLYHLYQHVL